MDLGRKVENEVAGYFRRGGVRVRMTGSGGGAFLKGDIHLGDDYLVEVKATGRESFSLRYDLMKKVKGQAFRVGKRPVIVVDVKGERWACVPLDEFLSLIKKDKEGL